MINNDNVGPKNRVVGCSGDLPLITLYEISALVAYHMLEYIYVYVDLGL